MSQGHDNSVEGGRIDVIRQAMTNIKLYNLSLPLKIVKPTTASLKKSDNIRKDFMLSTPAEPFTLFELFPNLPPELRLKIWKLALDDVCRVLRFDIIRFAGPALFEVRIKSYVHSLALSLTCVESRQAVSDNFEAITLAAGTGKINIYCNLREEIVVLTNTRHQSILSGDLYNASLVGLGHRELHAKTEILAIHSLEFENINRQIQSVILRGPQSRSRAIEKCPTFRILADFCNLQKLYIFHGCFHRFKNLKNRADLLIFGKVRVNTSKSHGPNRTSYKFYDREIAKTVMSHEQKQQVPSNIQSNYELQRPGLQSKASQIRSNSHPTTLEQVQDQRVLRGTGLSINELMTEILRSIPFMKDNTLGWAVPDIYIVGCEADDWSKTGFHCECIYCMETIWRS